MSEVRLPRDGAAYHCTWTADGVRCNQVTLLGLGSAAEILTVIAATGVDLMRALCPVHLQQANKVLDEARL